MHETLQYFEEISNLFGICMSVFQDESSLQIQCNPGSKTEASLLNIFISAEVEVSLKSGMPSLTTQTSSTKRWFELSSPCDSRPGPLYQPSTVLILPANGPGVQKQTNQHLSELV